MAKPLHRLTEANVVFKLSDQCEESCQTLKRALISTRILAFPNMEGKFIIDTEASNLGMGAVLSQVQDGQEKVICFYSKCFSKAERRYCVTRRELLAIVMAIKNFHRYLYDIFWSEVIMEH